MPRRLSYTDTALADLEAADSWLTQPGSGPVAWARLDAILTAIEGLRDHPCRWPLISRSGVRERLCAGAYRVLYEVDPDTGTNATAGDVRGLRPRPGPPRVALDDGSLVNETACHATARGLKAHKLTTLRSVSVGSDNRDWC